MFPKSEMKTTARGISLVTWKRLVLYGLLIGVALMVVLVLMN